jgi:hypothetical protein
MKPCRDCGVPTAASARSCPSCGILNPVLQWVALPNGEHLTRREPASGGGAVAMAAPRAPVFAPPASARPGDVFGQDRLASWAIWAILFQLLSATLIGGAIGGVIAAIISVPVGAVLPTRPDGRKLPVWFSITLIAVALFIFVGSIAVNARAQ